MKKYLLVFLGLVIVVGIGLGARFLSMSPSSHDALTQGGNIGGSFALIDDHGDAINDQSFRGKFMLVYFGYTLCPDICPTGLASISVALDRLGDDAEQLAPLFITTDPTRDSPEVMRAYISRFHPRIKALTGSEDQINAVKKAYKVYSEPMKHGPHDHPESINHSSVIYLMNKEGKFLTHFTHQTNAEDMVNSIRGYLQG